MTRLEAFRKTAMGAALGAALAAAASPAAAQPANSSVMSTASRIADREALRAERQAMRDQRRFSVAERKALARALAGRLKVIEDVSEKIERRSVELEWLMESYRAMNDDVAWALKQQGSSLDAQEVLALAANVMARHMALIEATGLSPGSADAERPADRIMLPATTEGVRASGMGFLAGLQSRIDDLVDRAAERSMEVYVEEGRAMRVDSAIGAVMAFAAGVEEDVEKASASLQEFMDAASAPSMK